VVLFNRAGTAVLLESQSAKPSLPQIRIPRFTRLAEQITAVLQSLWGSSVVLLFCELVGSQNDSTRYAILEHAGVDWPVPFGMDWFPVRHTASGFLDKTEGLLLQSIHRKTIYRGSPPDPEPFSRLGWMRNLQDWIRATLLPRGVELCEFEQLNASETFSLVRVATSQSPVWFKAVGQPNLREYGISLALARCLPNYVPTVLATKPEWHGWLMADTGGTTLREVDDPAQWRSAAETLAKLQLDSMGMTEELTDAGCRDLGIVKLLALVDPFLEVIAELMRQQTKFPPRILTSAELDEVGFTLKSSLECLAALQIPETLGHSDLNPGNIIVSPERCVFIDWAEGHVSHPFLTFEYLLSHLRKDCRQLVWSEDDIRTSYSRVWGQIVSKEQIEGAYLFSPLIAVYAYAVTGHAWRDPERLKSPEFQGYLRSLTRRMKQEVDLLQRRRVGCPS
jgi:hypothetical protein